MPKQKYDLNDNGKIDPEEREIMLEDRRRVMMDQDAKRDAQRRMAWFSLTGMLLFPFGVEPHKIYPVLALRAPFP